MKTVSVMHSYWIPLSTKSSEETCDLHNHEQGQPGSCVHVMTQSMRAALHMRSLCKPGRVLVYRRDICSHWSFELTHALHSLFHKWRLDDFSLCASIVRMPLLNVRSD